MNFLRRLFRRATKPQSAAARAEAEAQASARRYWKREVADEKERRGTADGRRKD